MQRNDFFITFANIFMKKAFSIAQTPYKCAGFYLFSSFSCSF